MIIKENGYQYTTTSAHISTITSGDTVIHNGEMKTVCGNNIKKDSFIGTTIFGDSYHLGYKAVIKVKFVTN